MSQAHRQRLLVVKQSAEAISCEFIDDSRNGLRVRNSACSGGCVGCTGLTGHSYKSKLVEIELPASFTGQTDATLLKIGQTFEVEAPAGMLLALSSVVYLLPVLLMLFFIVCGDLLFPLSEAQVALSAVVGLGIGLGAAFFLGPYLRLLIMKRLTLRGSHDNPRKV